MEGSSRSSLLASSSASSLFLRVLLLFTQCALQFALTTPSRRTRVVATPGKAS